MDRNEYIEYTLDRKIVVRVCSDKPLKTLTEESLQEYITKLQEWIKKGLLQFNKEKYKVMHLGRGHPAYQHHMENTIHH